MSVMNGRPARPPLPPEEPETAALRELSALPSWVLWSYEKPGDKWTKVPYSPRGHRASSTDQTTWTTFTRAMAAAGSGRFDGVGVVVDGRGITGWDFDHCVDAGGQIDPAVWRMVQALDSYTEYTPSGEGVRVYVHATLAEDARHKLGNVEVYDRSRFFTVTGRHVPGSPETIEQRQEECDALYAEVFGAKKREANAAPAVTVDLSDTALLAKAFSASNGHNIERLFSGHWQGEYGSQSEADLALCAHLAFWTGRDPDRIDRLFRQSGLFRPKWDERHHGDGRSYGRGTVDEAIGGCSEVYEPAEPSKVARLNGRVVTGPAEAFASDEPAGAPPDKPWPEPMGAEAFRGLVGDVVREVEPYTEADPHALLVSFLTAFGCQVGRGPHMMIGATTHAPRLFTLMLGRSSWARKGSSWDPVKLIVARADSHFEPRIQSGLSSGEGLISAVRDPKYGMVKGEEVMTDAGVADKRLMVVEPEFGSVLTRLKRDTNTLSAVLRVAWDGGDLRVATKEPLVATAPHISLIAHITPTELREKLANGDISNGMANRFMVILIRRARVLPRPEPLDGQLLEQLALRWRNAVQAASKIERVSWSHDAGRLWDAVYGDLVPQHESQVADLTARSAPIICRLAMLYALLDGARLIQPEHLTAAVEVWGYSHRCVEHVFGETTGDPIADVILRTLRRGGPQDRTEISALFARHQDSWRIQVALDQLSEQGLAYMRKHPVPNGRPREVWHLGETA